jgi:hypothetical protein
MQATRTEETKTKRARSPATKAKEEEKNKTPATKAKEEKDKTKRSIKMWNLNLKHKDNQCNVDLRRSATVLAAELEKTQKEYAAKLRRAAKKKKEDAANLPHTDDASTDDTTTDESDNPFSVTSSEASDYDSFSVTSSEASENPAEKKKSRGSITALDHLIKDSEMLTEKLKHQKESLLHESSTSPTSSGSSPTSTSSTSSGSSASPTYTSSEAPSSDIYKISDLLSNIDINDEACPWTPADEANLVALEELNRGVFNVNADVLLELRAKKNAAALI